jgi:hypothetical protein
VRWLTMMVGLLTLALGAACGGGADGTSHQWTLGDGKFIDTHPVTGTGQPYRHLPGDGSLAAITADVDVIAVVEVTEIVDLVIPTRPAPQGWPVEIIEETPWTTYRAHVEQWVKSSGGAEILIAGYGGIVTETELGQLGPGPHFIDGDFLLEPGRRYVLLMKDKPASIPAQGDYITSYGGRGGFEVTDGYVHVLNHYIADKVRWASGLTTEEFVDVLEGYLASPPPLETPSSEPSAVSTPPP